MVSISLACLLVLAIGATVGMAPARSSDEPPATITVTTTRTVVSSDRGVTAKAGAVKEHRMRHLAYVRLKLARGARRTLMASSTVGEAINLAAATYGYGDTLWRKARCESKLDPRAQNPSDASGLFQFLPSTFASTPYGGFSIWSAYANALAAGWMHAHGRGGEWVCS